MLYCEYGKRASTANPKSVPYSHVAGRPDLDRMNESIW